ncbi:MAG: hypothetical protein KatS3mg059_0160 [Thermomicrobiales bacterium]|nr:MAG: hypothetical protein KatS3mg059_0160 [Thermomicrobiales bacterium]
MRLAGMILGIVLIIASSFQTALAMGGALFSDEFNGEAWSGGLFIFLLLVGVAFAHGVPIAGASAYALAAVVAFIGASTTEFDDLYIWGGVAMLVSAVAFGGAYEKGKEQTRRRGHDEMVVALLNELRSVRLLLSHRQSDEIEAAGRGEPSRDGAAWPSAPAPADSRDRSQSVHVPTWHAPQHNHQTVSSPPVVSEPAPPPQPALSVVPDRGPAGTSVTAIGYGFRPGTQVYLAWAGNGRDARIVAQQLADPSGAVRFSFLIPEAPPGIYRVVAGAPGQPQAVAQLSVVATGAVQGLPVPAPVPAAQPRLS